MNKIVNVKIEFIEYLRKISSKIKEIKDIDKRKA